MLAVYPHDAALFQRSSGGFCAQGVAEGRAVAKNARGKSVSGKFQPTGGKRGKRSEKSHITRTIKNPFEASTGQKTQSYTRVQQDPVDTYPDVVQAARAGFPSLNPHGQAIPDSSCHFCESVSPESLFSSVGLVKSGLRVTFWNLPLMLGRSPQGERASEYDAIR